MLNILKSEKRRKTHFWDHLNVLRASILGANDGIISVSGIVLGAAGANLDPKTLFISGISGMLAGACSMAGGEWMSVSTQHDLQLKEMERQQTAEECEDCPIKLQQNDLLMPFHAAATSFVSFILGSLIPLAAITLSPKPYRVLITAIAMGISLLLNAIVSTWGTEVPMWKTILRNLLIGFLTIFITYVLGVVLS
ncbi:VIT1/CCC1 transporter family protein [Xylocopilactobacillus apis]|uniref:Membrane protein n=1 Tax=Xylocopilactobacillus apis TaxID=2932183 RepID=A0AAU9D8L0_9LACO|nr:VIT1/CCC1 transporter family protein [Xylocopilactobacillus apis]BDR56010.1 membrane protein [Xylocopilactobacillus apis]